VSGPIPFLTRIFLGIYFLEAGLLLSVAPWTIWWQRNYFADRVPWLGAAMHMDGLQGFVVVVGLATIVAGLAELRTAIARWWRSTRAAGRQGPDA
jgi:hypothetical protein